jgi:hypothetical protein
VKQQEQTVSEELILTPKQQQKQDAMALAELIYDIFHSTLSSAIINNESGKDNQND